MPRPQYFVSRTIHSGAVVATALCAISETGPLLPPHSPLFPGEVVLDSEQRCFE
jgi:hypothetical protein